MHRLTSIAAVSAIAICIAFLATLFFSGEVRSMDTGSGSSNLSGKIPPIDNMVPADIETATFSLG